MSDNKKPVAKINLHPVSASIWSNETQKGTFYSVTLERSYKDDDGKWQYTSSLGQGDLLLAAKVLDLAHSRFYELRAAERKAQPERRGRLTSWGRALFTGRSALFLHQFHQQRSHPMQVNLTWQVIDDDHIALVFDKPVWELFRARATERGTLATEMIADAVAVF